LGNLSNLQRLYLWPGNPDLCLSTPTLRDFFLSLPSYAGPTQVCPP